MCKHRKTRETMPEFHESYVASAPKREFGRSQGKRNRKETIEGGRRTQMGDCASQEVAIGEFSFVAIDFGDTILVSERISRSARNVENRATNQCFLLH